MSVSAKYSSHLDVRETLTVTASLKDNSVLLDGFSSDIFLNASSTPAATKVAAFSKALASGAATVDLTALVGTAGLAVTGLGLKVRAIKLQSASTNVGTFVVVPGASNGYNLFGAASSVSIKPGQEITAYFADGAVAVSSTAKTIDITGTGTESINCLVLLG